MPQIWGRYKYILGLFIPIKNKPLCRPTLLGGFFFGEEIMSKTTRSANTANTANTASKKVHWKVRRQNEINSSFQEELGFNKYLQHANQQEEEKEEEEEDIVILKEEKTFSSLGYSQSKTVTSRCIPEIRNKVGVKPLFGLELEADFGSRSDIKKFSPILNMGILCDDSSTDIEFVSAPLEFNTLMDLIWLYQPAFDNYLCENYRETTGMHVHYSRLGLSSYCGGDTTHLYRIDNLINSYPKFWMEVGNRRGNKYCRYDFNLQNPKTPRDWNRADSRYKALNVTNKETIEFRFFKSPSTAKGVIENLEWVHRIIEYTRKHDQIDPKKDLLHDFLCFCYGESLGTNAYSLLTISKKINEHAKTDADYVGDAYDDHNDDYQEYEDYEDYESASETDYYYEDD